MAIYKSRRNTLEDTNLADNLISDFKLAELQSEFLMFQLPSLWYLVRVALAD